MKDPRGHSPNSDALVAVVRGSADGSAILEKACHLQLGDFLLPVQENGRDLDSMRLFITQWPAASSSARDVRTTSLWLVLREVLKRTFQGSKVLYLLLPILQAYPVATARRHFQPNPHSQDIDTIVDEITMEQRSSAKPFRHPTWCALASLVTARI